MKAMADVIVRRMTIDDIQAVHQIEEATFATPWSEQSFRDEMTTNATARYMVILENDVIVGFGGAWCIFEEGHITNVAITENVRGRGYGRMLASALIQYAANLGVQYMTLEVRRSNIVAQNLYKSLGFEQLGVRKRYYEDNNEDALLMVITQMPEVDENFSE